MPADLAVLDAIAPEDVPAAILRLTARLVAAPPPVAPSAPTDDLVGVEDVARMLGVTRRWVWRHARELGARRVSRRKLAFSRRKVARWLDSRGVYA